mmetsp:Transcript_46129/g.103663  ORF Transcript_46129/g.103663 Transcript_46129/m.103663 type:complete len:101 (+) Transcript_46129:847-1149(+)
MPLIWLSTAGGLVVKTAEGLVEPSFVGWLVERAVIASAAGDGVSAAGEGREAVEALVEPGRTGGIAPARPPRAVAACPDVDSEQEPCALSLAEGLGKFPF